MRASVARATRAATKCAASARAPGTCVCRFRFFAKAEGLAQTKIQREAIRAFRKVDRNNRLAGLRGQIKATVRGSLDTGCTGRARAKRRASVEDGILVKILASRDIEGDTGLRDEERTQPERVRQGHRPSEKHAMADVEGGPAVILADVEWIRRETPRAGNIALGVAESVVAGKRKLRSHSNAAIHNELILLEDAFGLILEDILVRAIGPQAGDGIGGVQVGGEKLVYSARVQIGHR